MLITAAVYRYNMEIKPGEDSREFGRRVGDATAWSYEHFGRAGFPNYDDHEEPVKHLIVGGHWTMSGSQFWFSEDKHALEFKLRWL